MPPPAGWSAQQWRAVGHWLVLVHFGAQIAFPAASLVQAEPAVQQFEPQTLAVAQQEPPTHDCPPGHVPVGCVGLHGVVVQAHVPRAVPVELHVCKPLDPFAHVQACVLSGVQTSPMHKHAS